MLLAGGLGSAFGQTVSVQYDALLPDNAHAKNVRQVEVAVSPEGADAFWIRLTGTKVNQESYTVWFLADRLPFAADPATVEIRRYILQETQEEPMEYVQTGGAALPLFDFVGQLIPRTHEPINESLFEKGSYLGFPILRKSSAAANDVRPPEKVQRLILRSDLHIGTSRNFRDDGQPRKQKTDNYNYIPFTKSEYDEMIAAGINAFVARGEQIDWIKRRAVYYERMSPSEEFPEELYRPNFLGTQMFIDEPACILAGKYPPGSPLSTAVSMIQEHIRGQMKNRTYAKWLMEKGIQLGAMELIEPKIPIWETYIETSFYQLQANPTGIIQECRWRIHPTGGPDEMLFLQRINELFGTDIAITPENLFLWSYSQMRGAARACKAKWGMSIYGQAEPELRYPSMQLAYHLGAECIWFWTSDHDHHVPYTEQLDLARRISEYAKMHPRDLNALRDKAKTVIVLPYGYTLPTVWQMFTWGTHIYPLDRKNEKGLTYKEVLTPAVEQIARCLKEKIAYDVIPCGQDFKLNGYQEIIRIFEDGNLSIHRAAPTQ